MKHVLIFCLLFPIASYAQTQADYERTMDRFVKFYNNKQGDSIIKMSPPAEANSEWMKNTWGKEGLTSSHKEYGKIISKEYLGIDTEDPNPGLAVFRVKFSKEGWVTTSFTVDKNGYFETFRLITSSEGIDKLLKKKK